MITRRTLLTAGSALALFPGASNPTEAITGTSPMRGPSREFMALARELSRPHTYVWVMHPDYDVPLAGWVLEPLPPPPHETGFSVKTLVQYPGSPDGSWEYRREPMRTYQLVHRTRHFHDRLRDPAYLSLVNVYATLRNPWVAPASIRGGVLNSALWEFRV